MAGYKESGIGKLLRFLQLMKILRTDEPSRLLLKINGGKEAVSIWAVGAAACDRDVCGYLVSTINIRKTTPKAQYQQ